MLSFGSTQTISYLGLPKKYQDVSFSITTFDDFLLLIYDLARYNISLGTKLVCIDVNSLDLDPSFLDSVPEEENLETSKKLEDLNLLINKNDLRISLFLTKDLFLGSQLEGVAEKTAKTLNQLSLLLDCIGVDYPSIVTRVGSAYGNRKETMKNYCHRAFELNDGVISKLIVTNDDKPSLFSTTDLLSGIYYESGIPICFRYLPHHFNDGGLSFREALFLSCSTWKETHKPLYVYAEAGEIDQYGFPISSSVSSFLSRRIPTFGLECEIVLDSPERDNCLVKYRSELKSLPPVVLDRVN